jgi:hypothetical protein
VRARNALSSEERRDFTMSSEWISEAIFAKLIAVWNVSLLFFSDFQDRQAATKRKNEQEILI